MSERAVLVVDIQEEYFANGLLPLVNVDEAASAAAKVISHARAAGDEIIYIQHEFTDPNIPFFKHGSAGVAIHPSVQPEQGDEIVLKNYPNSFRDTRLRSVLDEKGVASLVIVGSMSSMCIDATARAAADFGYHVTVVHDACATRDLEFDGVLVPAAHVHAAFMAALAFPYAKVQSLRDFVTSSSS